MQTLLILLLGLAPLVDGRGRTVDTTKTPERIVSCSLASDETILELLGRAGHLARLQAVSTLADDPTYSNAGKIPDAVKGRCGGELESLLKLKPDLAILASFNKADMLARLDNAGVRTFVLGGFDHLDGIEAHITELGRLVHEDAAAAALLQTFRTERRLLSTPPKGARRKVLQFYPDGTVSGADTLFDELATTAGAVNVAAAAGLKGWPRLSTETLAAMRPDLIVVGDALDKRDEVLKRMRSLPGWKEIPAVKEGRIVLIPDNELGSVSYHVLKALAKLRAAIDKLGGAVTAATRAAAVSFGVLAASIVLATLLGASGLTPAELWRGAFAWLAGRTPDDAESYAQTVLFSIRLPRALTAALCGGALAAAGTVSQGLFRNGLASPSVLGTEAGGSLTAVVLFYFGAAYLHWVTLPLAAFVGALATTAFIFRLATRERAPAVGTLLLAGFAVNAFAGALTSLVVSLSLEDYQKAGAVMHWLLGGFAAKGWEHVGMAAVPLALGFALSWFLAPRLDVVALGEDVASTLSIDMRKLRRAAIVAIALLVGAAVAVAGALPFVGLVVPHFTRLAVGPRHRPLLLLSTVNGMSLTLLADLVARTVRAPAELEVGILTSLLGAPFFLWLLLAKEPRKA